MVQVVEQTHDEKMKMYMKVSKKKLAEMLINCNNILSQLTPIVVSVTDNDGHQSTKS